MKKSVLVITIAMLASTALFAGNKKKDKKSKAKTEACAKEKGGSCCSKKEGKTADVRSGDKKMTTTQMEKSTVGEPQPAVMERVVR